MDNLCLQVLTEELKGRLARTRIRKVKQLNDHEFLFSLRHPCPHDLVLILRQQFPCLFLRSERSRGPGQGAAGDWLLSVRRHLVDADIVTINKELEDRVVTITIEDSRSSHAVKILYLRLELIPGKVNALLVNRHGQVLRSFRPVRPLTRATPPSSTGLGSITKEGFFDLMLKPSPESSAAHRLPAEQRRLQEGIRGLSPLFAQELTHRSPRDPETLWRRLQHLLRHVQKGPYKPRVYGPSQGKHQWACAPFSLESLEGRAYRESPDMNTAVAEQYALFQADQQFLRRRQLRASQLRQQRKKKTRLLEGLQSDLRENLQAQRFKKYSDLLLAQAPGVPAGQCSLRLPDLFQPEQPEVVIPLEPRLSLLQNATRYAQRFRKASRAIPKIQARLEAVQAEIRDVDQQQERLDQARAVEELEGPSRRGRPGSSAGMTRPGSSREGRKPALSKVSRQFLSSEGLAILVGKGSRQNDNLTAKMAHSDDFWLHVAGYAGSHVVLRNPDKLSAPPARSLLEAAQLAAYFSQARNAPKIEVHYTQKRFVSKPRGAKPGVVRLRRYQSIVVHPCVPDSVERSSSPRASSHPATES